MSLKIQKSSVLERIVLKAPPNIHYRPGIVWTSRSAVAAEVSAEGAIVRGLFQCVKYRAVMEAVLLSESRPQNARALLVLESKLPPSLISLRNMLGVEVVEGVSPANG